jgi:hypothetical protein
MHGLDGLRGQIDLYRGGFAPVDRFAGDRIAETWSHRDTLGMLQPLGAIPSPEAARAATVRGRSGGAPSAGATARRRAAGGPGDASEA